MAEKEVIDDSVFDRLIVSKNGGTYKDVAPLFSDWAAFSYTIDQMVKRLEPLDKRITKICCPSGDTTFASTLAYKLGLGVIVLNPYDGLIVSGNELSPEDGILIVGTALCGGSMYFSMYTLIEDMGASVLGFAFLIEKVWHRGRYKLMDNTLRGLPLGVISLIKYGVTVGNFVRFDCSAHGLGIREFRVLSVKDDQIGVNWLDGPVPCEKLFPKTRIIEMSFDKRTWVKYRE
jgi:adenine/guanine phosphoribosyltransferase-like PRPP-binding protein